MKAQATHRSACTRLSQSSIWFQLVKFRVTAPLWFFVGTLRSIVLPRDTDYGQLMLPINRNALGFAEYAVGVQEGEEAT